MAVNSDSLFHVLRRAGVTHAVITGVPAGR